MRPTALAAAVAAALVIAVQPGTAAAQPTLERVAAGPAFAGGAFPDAGFQHAYSFRATGFAPGSGADGAVGGGVGACHAGDPCELATARGWVPGESRYFIGIEFGGQLVGPPSLYVNSVGTGTTGAGVELDAWNPDAPLDAFYVVLTPPAGGAMALGNGTFFGAPPEDAPGFTTNGAGSWYALYRHGDLHDGMLIFDLDLTGNVDGAGAPAIEVYVGSLATTAPEPGTWVLTASGLLAMMALVRRPARRAPARSLTPTRRASSPRP